MTLACWQFLVLGCRYHCTVSVYLNHEIYIWSVCSTTGCQTSVLNLKFKFRLCLCPSHWSDVLCWSLFISSNLCRVCFINKSMEQSCWYIDYTSLLYFEKACKHICFIRCKRFHQFWPQNRHSFRVQSSRDNSNSLTISIFSCESNLEGTSFTYRSKHKKQLN